MFACMGEGRCACARAPREALAQYSLALCIKPELCHEHHGFVMCHQGWGSVSPVVAGVTSLCPPVAYMPGT
eukprot:15472477-Alexandrium_andersonii.AAC.2